MYVFCTTQYCKSRIKFFFLKWEVGEKEKYENHFLITWQSTYSFFLNICYPTHFVVCTISYLVVVLKNLVRFVVCWNFVVDSLTTCSWVSLCCWDVSSPVCCAFNPFCLLETYENKRHIFTDHHLYTHIHTHVCK